LREANDVSCLNSRAIIQYIRRKKPEALRELFSGVPAPYSGYDNLESFLCEENNWVPSSLFTLLMSNAQRITGNPNVAFDIGFESITHREFGYIQRLFLTIFSTPKRIIKRLNQINTKFNTTKIIETVYDAPGRFVVRWHWRQDAQCSKDTCSYNKGIYSAIPTLWGFEPCQIVENTCYFTGGPYCEIVLPWSLTKGWMRNIVMRTLTRRSRLFNALEEIEKDKNILREQFDQLNVANRALNEKVRLLKAINSATWTLVSEVDTQKILQKTMQPIVDVLGFSRALVMLTDENGENLEYRCGVGESRQAMEKLIGYRVPLSRDQNLMVRVLKQKKPVIVDDVKAFGLNPANLILADFNPTSFIICPLVAQDKTIGLLGADRGEGGSHVTDDDLEFLSILANSLATVIQRARLDEELKSSYTSSVRALVQAIEEKDTYTRGHSVRVAAIAVEIARVLGLPERDIEYLSFGSMLHDVGKIGIPEYIVQSPKPLSDAEAKIIQRHTLKGVEILQPISFIKNHLYLIKNHHERYDGKGYPDRLRGEQIPLGAQIVAVADAFDAMTSSRPYRKRLPVQQAAQEIKKESGTQFSPTVAEAFLKVLADPQSFEKLSFLRDT
jgi:putative nucleotidyltransferase with HDIG domain